jgi:serine/threonine protein kinase
MPLQSGQRLQNRYRIANPLGQGGMGAVYLAYDSRLNNKPVAIKEFNPFVLPPQDRQWATAAFEQEAQILGRLNHPALTAVTDYFTEQSMVYLVMEYIEGVSLEQLWSRQPHHRFDAQDVLNWAQQLCAVLAYLHSQTPPVIFRDLKPANVMVQPSGQIKLIDFGIARYFKPGQTRDTIPLGTVGYAAPEQFGHKQADARSDIYSLGVILHQLLTGNDPTQNPPQFFPAGQKATQLPPRFSKVIAQALQYEPDQRPQNIQQFQALLFANENRAILKVVGGFLAIAFLGALVLLWDSPSWSIIAMAATPTNPPTSHEMATAIVFTITVPVTVDIPTATSTIGSSTATPIVTTTAPASPTATTPTSRPGPLVLDPINPAGKLLFVSNRNGQDAIFIMDTADPESAYQLTNPDGRDWWPTWCGSDNVFFERAAEGNNPSWQEIYRVSVTNPAQVQPISSNRLPANSNMNGFPSCSSDGRYLAFSSRAATAARSNDFNIGFIDTQQSTWQFTLFGSGYSLAGSVAWSPDSQTVSFMHYIPSRRRFEVYRLALSAPHSPFSLTEEYGGSSKYPVWSPDGSQVAFACTHEPFDSSSSTWGLCITPSHRSDIQLLLPNLHQGGEYDRTTEITSHAVTPSWSPDNRWLAFASNQSGKSSIYLYNVETQAVTSLTGHWPGREMHPRWVP